jgi:aspartate oxidase
MSAKYTLGPWRVGRWPEIVATDERETIVCEVSGAMSNPQAMADAQLIAAAPELLELLEEYGLQFNDEDEARAEFGIDAVSRELRRRAAIAKATGKEDV